MSTFHLKFPTETIEINTFSKIVHSYECEDFAVYLMQEVQDKTQFWFEMRAKKDFKTKYDPQDRYGFIEYHTHPDYVVSCYEANYPTNDEGIAEAKRQFDYEVNYLNNAIAAV